jgi:hypothetical protein
MAKIPPQDGGLVKHGAPANRHLNPTESRFIDRLNESFASFATQSGAKRTCGNVA